MRPGGTDDNGALDVEEACRRADWYGRYALDRLDEHPERFDRRMRSQLVSQTVHSRTVVSLLDRPVMAPGAATGVG